MKQSNNQNQLEVSTYNVMMRGWANLGRLDKVKELFRLMKLAKIEPNMHSYALNFLCVANRSSYDSKLIKTIMNEMDKKGLPINRLLIDSNLHHDEEKLVKNLLKSQHPELSFVQSTVQENYECSLLEKLNKTEKTFNSLPLPISTLKERRDEQFQSEKKSFIALKSVYIDRNMSAHQLNNYFKIWNRIDHEWRSTLRKVLKDKLDRASIQFLDHSGINIYPFLSAIDINTLADVIMDEVKNLVSIISEYHSPPFSTLCLYLGNRVENVYLIKIKQQHASSEAIRKVYDSYLETIARERKFNSRIIMEKKAKDMNLNFKSNIHEMKWSYFSRIEVGKFLYSIILENLTIDQKLLYPKASKKNHHIVYTYYQTTSTRMNKLIRPNKMFATLCKALLTREVRFDCNNLPMLCPPLPWISPKIGAYLLQDSEFIREINKSAPIGNVNDTCPTPVLDALNTLQMQPWKINQPILDLMIRIFNLNGDVNLDIPLHESVMPLPPKITKDSTAAEKANFIKEKMRIEKARSEMYSLWCDCLYKLSIANHFREKVIWMPHNLDFRGRVYTIPPHLQHLGSDLSRGLLLFATSKPLGPNGLDWLKIHLINLTGTKKHSSNQERLEYCDEILDKVLSSARDPLSPEGSWWKESEEPWQTLACCMEIDKAIASGNPEAYECHFPVHQDGSCNGLQHYAALGRDQVGAESVNLQKFDQPQDVYNEVAKLVEKEREKDAAEGCKIATSLEGVVSRKVVKQPVMTFVYGVTRYGARKQVMKRLNELSGFNKANELKVSDYLVNKVFISLAHMFTATREIQTWFNACADIISKRLDRPVKWTTPLGFQVEQPYVKYVSKNISSEKHTSFEWKINSMKQKNGFAPNFIHSLDSVHMMLTALNCEANGIDFVAVHDCFWIHPCNVESLNRICRQEFVSMHSLPILSNLSDSFVQTYSKELSDLASKSPEDFNLAIETLIAVPATGTFDLKQVLQSQYFFS